MSKSGIVFGVDNFNRMISIPHKLITDDGRELRIEQWIPEAKAGHSIEVTLRAVIMETNHTGEPWLIK